MTQPYSLLRPVSVLKPRPGPDCVVRVDDLDFVALRAEIGRSPAWAYDYETRGTETWKSETGAVGLALAWLTADGAIDYVYVDDSSGDGGRLASLLTELWVSRARDATVCSYNAYFDSAITRMHLRRRGEWPEGGEHPTLQVTRDCYLLHRLLASEGWAGQSWSLKYAMMQLLGWPDTNEAGIDEWLLGHGYHSAGPARLDGEAPEIHLARLQEWIATNPDTRRVSPNKAEMWRVPPDILGSYACLDAVATLQLWLHVLEPVCLAHPLVGEWHDEYSRLTSLLIDQQFRGIRIDRVGLEAHGEKCASSVAEAEMAAASRPEIAHALAAWREARLTPEREKEPAKFRKRKARTEPSRFTKAGAESKNWRKWRELEDAPPEPTKTWPAWRARMDAAEAAEQFSWASGDQLRWLLYGAKTSKWPGIEWGGLLPFEWGEEPDLKKGRRGTIHVEGRFGRVELERTKQGGLPVDDVVLNQLADGLREPILEAASLRKEKQYVDAYLQLAHFHHNHRPGTSGWRIAGSEGGEWRIHPGWTVHGTKTGRLAGKDPSLHQAPKSIEFLRHLIPDEGTTWVEMDFSALEPYTLAGLSRDAGLMDLYGPGARAHDRYLYSVSKYPGALGDAVRRLYPSASDWARDPEAAAEAVSRTKTDCKRERTIGKTLVLSGDYGAGWRKQLRRLNAEGVRISAEDMKRLNQAHRDLHRGVYVDYAGRLEDEWRSRGGWILSGLGLPTPVHGDRLKDLVNRQVQRTGHDYLVLLVGLVHAHLIAAGIQHTGVVWDFHDQLIIQVPFSRADAVCTLISECVTRLNDGLGLDVRLKGEPTVAANFAAAKLEGEWKKWLDANRSTHPDRKPS